MAETKSQDAIALLKADHRAVEELFEKFEKASDYERKRKLAEEICLELSVHAQIEEEIFYPACEGKVDEDLLKESYVEHDGAKILIAEISKGSPDDEFYDAKVKVLQEDATNPRGQRNVIDGEAEMLEGFEFNKNGKLGTTLFAPFTGTIDRVAGTLTVDIPAFVPQNMIDAPGGTTHFKIVSAGSEVDFENEKFVVDTQETTILPWDPNPTAVINLVNTVTANSTHPLFLALGISFYQQVNGQMYPLKNGAFNALALVKVLGL